VVSHAWDRVQQIFLEAVDLPPADRAAFLDRACAGDAALRAEVESLLHADVADSTPLHGAIGREVASMLDAASLDGARVGAYRILSEIGRGGMGSVYLAERDDDQYRKLVAIKVVRRGMDTDEVLDRFRHERQILASLEHPFIARLIDGGTTPDGRPFFVMEYVEGRPIDEYCRHAGLDVRARLRLFVQVCEAVAYAHRALVVHRDLKPGNILVTRDGVPKLLDFGVAKLLDPGADPQLTATWMQVGPLTPEYASPEQVRGHPVTTATDVYALGAILFELLTGVRAQRVETHTPAEIERIVCETDVARPSTVAGAAPRVDGDLDTIVLMAMRKEPERRYRSVDALAEDVRRRLDGRPVLARQDSLTYRARKFAARHSVAIIAVALVLASVIGGATLAMLQAREAQKARHTAERRLAEIVELSDRTLYDVHSMLEKLPGGTEARKQIVTTTLKFLEDLSKDAGQDDALRFVLSVSYSKVADVLGSPLRPNLGDSRGALDNYARSIALVEPLLAKEPNRADYLRQWLDAKGNLATVMARNGNDTGAEAIERSLIPQARRLATLCPRDPDCLLTESTVYSDLIEMLQSTDSQSAFAYARLQTQTDERALQTLPGNPIVERELATAYSQEAKMLNQRGELAAAADRYQHAVALRERAVGRDPSNVIARRSLMITYGNLGGNLGSPFVPNLGDSAGAQQYYSKAVAIARDLAAADPKNQLAQYDLGNALLFRATLDVGPGEVPDSLALLREADDVLDRVTAADPQAVSKVKPLAMVQEYEGRRLEALHRDSEAAVQYRRSIASTEKGRARLPSDLSLLSQLVASSAALAELLARTGAHDEAVAVARSAVDAVEHTSAPASERWRVAAYVARGYESLATVQASGQRWAEAKAAADRALVEFRQIVEAGSPRATKADVARVEALLLRIAPHQR
jgi:serine/threonine protein kinase/tetratricopeptide (TPR) repeat protein